MSRWYCLRLGAPSLPPCMRQDYWLRRDTSEVWRELRQLGDALDQGLNPLVCCNAFESLLPALRRRSSLLKMLAASMVVLHELVDQHWSEVLVLLAQLPFVHPPRSALYPLWSDQPAFASKLEPNPRGFPLYHQCLPLCPGPVQGVEGGSRLLGLELGDQGITIFGIDRSTPSWNAVSLIIAFPYKTARSTEPSQGTLC